MRAKLNADVEGIITVLRGGRYTPVYWTPALFADKVREHRGYPATLVEQRKWQEFHDALIPETKRRITMHQKRVNKEYYENTRLPAKRADYAAHKEHLRKAVENFEFDNREDSSDDN